MSHVDRRRPSFPGIAVVGLLVLAACGKDDGISPDPPPVPASVQKTAGTDSQIVVVGTTLPVDPSVKVLSADGRPVPGVTVTFTVDGGGGVVTGATPVTDANGVATLGSWRVGTSSGVNSLTVSVGTLPTIAFHALGRAGPAVALLKTEASDNNGAFVGRILFPPPEVRVVDAYGNGVAGAQVSFTVTSGGGTLAGPIPLTNDDGYTGALNWRLGTTPGVNTIRASAVGLTAVDFTATAVARCQAAAIATETTVSGELAATDCTEGLFYYDHYSVTLPQGAAVSFNATSSAFDTYLVLHDEHGRDIAGSDDFEQGSTNSRIKAILPPGQFEASVSSYWMDETGPYQFSSGATQASIENCEEVWAVPGIVTAQSIKSTDCPNDYGPIYDWLWIVLRAGETVTISMESAAWTPGLELYGPFGIVAGGLGESIVHTPRSDGLYAILATNAAGAAGDYTLRISAVAPSVRTATTALGEARGWAARSASEFALGRGTKKGPGAMGAQREMVSSAAAVRERQASQRRAQAARAISSP